MIRRRIWTVAVLLTAFSVSGSGRTQDRTAAVTPRADDSKPAPPARSAEWIRERLSEVDAKVDAEAKDLVALYQHLHSNPELSLMETKTAARLAEELTKADFTVWVDAGAWFGPNLAEAALAAVTDDYAWVMFPHPHRTSLIDEVAVSRTLPKYDLLPLEEQVDFYMERGYPDEALWATGCIGRGRNAYNTQFGAAWMSEVVRWGFQDQLSFAYLAWMSDLEIAPLGPSLFTSSHVEFADHTQKV